MQNEFMLPIILIENVRFARVVFDKKKKTLKKTVKKSKLSRAIKFGIKKLAVVA